MTRAHRQNKKGRQSEAWKMTDRAGHIPAVPSGLNTNKRLLLSTLYRRRQSVIGEGRLQRLISVEPAETLYRLINSSASVYKLVSAQLCGWRTPSSQCVGLLLVLDPPFPSSGIYVCAARRPRRGTISFFKWRKVFEYCRRVAWGDSESSPLFIKEVPTSFSSSSTRHTH